MNTFESNVKSKFLKRLRSDCGCIAVTIHLKPIIMLCNWSASYLFTFLFQLKSGSINLFKTSNNTVLLI